MKTKDAGCSEREEENPDLRHGDSGQYLLLDELHHLADLLSGLFLVHDRCDESENEL
jgi:hypothetical protein